MAVKIPKRQLQVELSGTQSQISGVYKGIYGAMDLLKCLENMRFRPQKHSVPKFGILVT